MTNKFSRNCVLCVGCFCGVLSGVGVGCGILTVQGISKGHHQCQQAWPFFTLKTQHTSNGHCNISLAAAWLDASVAASLATIHPCNLWSEHFLSCTVFKTDFFLSCDSYHFHIKQATILTWDLRITTDPPSPPPRQPYSNVSSFLVLAAFDPKLHTQSADDSHTHAGPISSCLVIMYKQHFRLAQAKFV